MKKRRSIMLKIISVMFAAITAIGCIELSGVFSMDVYAAYDLHSSGVMDESRLIKRNSL